MEQFICRLLQPEEFNLVKNFPPEEWHLDLEDLLRYHEGHSYFYPLCAASGNDLAGTGIAIVLDDTAWLGAIIVKEEFRNMGLGTRITKALISYAESKNCRKIILIASALGYPVYKKIGFIVSGHYLFFHGGNIHTRPELKTIQKLGKPDYDRILELDHQATGERREELFIRAFPTGYKYTLNRTAEGFYLPDFGKGLIIAENTEAGLNLLRYKLLNHADTVVIPHLNEEAIRLVSGEGYKEYMRSPRMFLKQDASWQPRMIFSRGAGYCG